MTRLPWHGRSRTKSSGEKSHLSGPQDWFTRNTSEPSRQALSELVKAHRREKSEESNTMRSRSRGTTITSVDWPKDGSQTGSMSEDVWSTPSSPQRGREGSVCSTADRAEGTTRNLLSKGSMMLRRTGSKMSLSSTGSSSNLVFMSPPRGQSSTTSSGNPASRDEIRNRISAPFDFQHVKHTEQPVLSNLGPIEELGLAQGFNATPKQPEAFELRSTDSWRIQTSGKSGLESTIGEPMSATHDSLHQLPMTPPRPDPPPKDVVSSRVVSGLPSPSLPTTSSGSTQFSTFDLLPFIDTSFGLADVPSPLPSARSSSKLTGDDNELEAKPLPQLPVIHAVTTEDDTARAMIAAPLPTPPMVTPSISENESLSTSFSNQRPRSSLTSPRHASFHPSSKSSMPNLLIANQLSTMSRTLPRHHSDMALSQQAKEAQAVLSSRSSTTFGAIDTMNWEEAVDEAWDVVDELDEDMSSHQSLSFEQYDGVKAGFLDPANSEYGRSAVSTPLMMAAPHRAAAPASERASPVLGMEPHKLESVQEDEQQTEISGLGISSCPPSGSMVSAGNFSRSSSIHLPRRRSSLSYSTPDRLTRSSSQESIILSIASSIIGTTRSSNSSVLADDLMSARKAHDEGLTDNMYQSARPESGCLPADLFEQMSKAGLTLDSSDEAEKVEIPPIPPTPSHKYSKSTSKVTVPERRSSMVASEHSKANRNRSHTAGTRPPQLNTRISYSLFPNKIQSPYPTAVTT